MDYEVFKAKVRDLIQLDLSSYKQQQMKRRILQWIARHELNDFSGLFNTLKTDADHRREFIDYLTINTSHFFRDQGVFDYLAEKILPAIASSQARIWSAGCSIGAEPYSIAMIMLDKKLPFAEIIATDIDEDSLKRAAAGVYYPNQVSQVPTSLLERYFTTGKDHYQLKEIVKRQVKFLKHNLLTDPYHKGFDLILCRNVFIYFTSEIQNRLIKQFVASLKQGGYFVVGSAELIINPAVYGLDRVSYCIYQKG
ncbi:MAG: protein-glutamate O-methyltransferase CheR [Limnochordia bacterium]|jgi:chemotaxis protein methyltransferase CheR|nr:protein-glutamate O-methyltransferase CheR [Bacillota bacterium]HOB07949.1 protein-glutamate O-methyltransferase CheR [Limnochordia bacterium]NLH31555.1 protein-glutamate O-methyltransferase CheR [Bacillota bacterium]HPT92115.1 protein-glutamate O-methyltransferase CheR [Limnochordia bacterium]HPZ29898.1 protein-glutamate O-methyltransferase CheR [Limnochordia bacterium]